MAVRTSFDGLDTLVQSVEDAADNLADLDQVNATAGQLVVQAVDAPRLTGALASTVDAIPDRHGFTLTAGGRVAPYAAIVHARNPFLTRALTNREDAVVDTYADHVTDTVQTIRGA